MNLQIKASQLMSGPVRKLTPGATVRDAAQFLLDAGISGAPVADYRGDVIGVFSLTDMAKHVQDRLLELPTVDPRHDRVKETGEYVPAGKGFHFEAFDDITVSDLMTPGVVSVRPDATLDEILGHMTALGIHRVFVTSEEGSLAGVITTMDILKWLKSSRKAHASGVPGSPATGKPAASRRKEPV